MSGLKSFAVLIITNYQTLHLYWLISRRDTDIRNVLHVYFRVYYIKQMIIYRSGPDIMRTLVPQNDIYLICFISRCLFFKEL